VMSITRADTDVGAAIAAAVALNKVAMVRACQCLLSLTISCKLFIVKLKWNKDIMNTDVLWTLMKLIKLWK